jgi:hypothetical protein
VQAFNCAIFSLFHQKSWRDWRGHNRKENKAAEATVYAFNLLKIKLI